MRASVSVIMSVYNGSRFVGDAIEGILEQTFSDFEFIIIDDGSVDNSWEILSKYASRDKRIMLVQNLKNIGLTKSLNKALKISSGKFIARQDADDISLPNRLKIQVDYLNSHPDVVLVSCNLDCIDQNGQVVSHMKLDCDFDVMVWNLLFYNYLGGHSQVLFRRYPVIAIGGYAENYRYAQDYELWIRLLKFGKIVIIPDTLLQYRIHDSRLSYTASGEQLRCILKTSQEHLSQYLPDKPKLSEVVYLWGFWNLRYPPALDSRDSNQTLEIHERFKEIYDRYLLMRSQTGSIDHNLSRALRLLIAERYVKWTLVELLHRRRFVRAVSLLNYAVEWAGLRLWNVAVNLCRAWIENYRRQRNLR